MNLFYLDDNLDYCAEYHVDKHVSKMILEAGQQICTNLYIDRYIGYAPEKLDKEQLGILNSIRKGERDLPMEERSFPYLPTMPNHPCTVWVRKSLDNFEWAVCYAFALESEYHYRYGKSHKTADMLRTLPDPINIPRCGFTTFGLAMPDILKDYNDPVTSYRKFYMLDKATFASWSHRGRPFWWDDSFADYENRISQKG